MNRSPDDLVFAFHPTSRGYGYVLFEGPLAPYDWGVKKVHGERKNHFILRFVKRVFDEHHPALLVLEDALDKTAHRSIRIRVLYRKIIALAEQENIPVFVYSRTAIRKTFAHFGHLTKHDLAVEIAKHIPAFSYQLPPIRKPWMSYDVRQGLYDAVAVGLTYYGGARKRTDS